MCWGVVLLHTLVSSSDAHRGYICLLNWGGFQSGCVHVLAGCFVGCGSVSSFDERNGLVSFGSDLCTHSMDVPRSLARGSYELNNNACTH
jgi:hypothetical protein